jgi:hypothetical protein
LNKYKNHEVKVDNLKLKVNFFKPQIIELYSSTFTLKTAKAFKFWATRVQPAPPALFELFFYLFSVSPSGGIGAVFSYVCSLKLPINSPFHIF